MTSNPLIPLAVRLSLHNVDLADELMVIGEELDVIAKRRKQRTDVGKRRGPQRKRWRKQPANKRRQRKRWLRSPAGKKYQRRRKRTEKRPSTKRYRKRMKNRGVHRKYPWLR